MFDARHWRGVIRLAPQKISAGLRRRLRQWSRRLSDALPHYQRAWREPTRSTELLNGATGLLVHSTAELRRYLAGRHAVVPIRRLRVVVEEWQPPLPGWSGRLGPLRHVTAHTITLPARGPGRAEVSVHLERSVPVRLVVAAVLQALEPSAPMPTPVSPSPAAEGADHDMVVATPSAVLVDAATANPAGRRRYDTRLPSGVLHLAERDGGVRWSVTRGAADRTPIVEGTAGDVLDARQRDVLANLSTITYLSGDTPTTAAATVLAQLAMTGILLQAPDLPPPVVDLLGTELAAFLAQAVPAADPVDRELASIRQRRAALRRHATGLAISRGARPPFPGLAQPPSVTALLLTRRPDRLPEVLGDLARQTYPDLEVVVGLHGSDPPPAALAAVDAHPRPVEVHPVSGELCFGEALGAVTRRARGSLVAKIDDDDRYGPEHVWDLVLARHYSGATLVGKGAEFVYLAPRDVTVRRRMDSEVYDRYVAGGTLLLGRGDLEAIGGWRPVRRSVDRALIDRVLAAGGTVYRTHGFGYLYTRSHIGHTWDVNLDQFEKDGIRRWSGLPPYDEFGLR